jgi:hypothetical protein
METDEETIEVIQSILAGGWVDASDLLVTA